MKLIRVRCTNCGADFENVEDSQSVFHCTRPGCGATFVVEQGRKFSELEVEKTEKIEKYREALKKSLRPFDREQALFYAQQIAALIPDDFRARAVISLCELKQGQPRSLRRLLEKRTACTEDEFREVFPYILEMGEYRELMLLEGAIDMYVPDARAASGLKRQIVDRKEEIRISSELYADVPRDVFICHSSMQADIAMQVVEALEKDGNTCWISSRNLLPDAPDYWREIERAVSRCRVFLVLCSEAAMLSKDVQAELRYAERYKNERLELKLDAVPHTTQFKYFFNGITWVDAVSGLEAALPELKRRAYMLLHADEIREAEKRAQEEARAREAERARQEEKARQEAQARAAEIARREAQARVAEIARQEALNREEQARREQAEREAKAREEQQARNAQALRLAAEVASREAAEKAARAAREKAEAERAAQAAAEAKRETPPPSGGSPVAPAESAYEAVARKRRRGGYIWFAILSVFTFAAYGQLRDAFSVYLGGWEPAYILGVLAVTFCLLGRSKGKPHVIMAILTSAPVWGGAMMSQTRPYSFGNPQTWYSLCEAIRIAKPALLLLGTLVAVASFMAPLRKPKAKAGDEAYAEWSTKKGKVAFALLSLVALAYPLTVLYQYRDGVSSFELSILLMAVCYALGLIALLYALLLKTQEPHVLAALLISAPRFVEFLRRFGIFVATPNAVSAAIYYASLAAMILGILLVRVYWQREQKREGKGA